MSVFLKSTGSSTKSLREISCKNELETVQESLFLMLQDFEKILDECRPVSERFPDLPSVREEQSSFLAALEERNCKIFLLMEEETIVGYALVESDAGSGKRDVYLSQYYILSAYRSQGYGTAYLSLLSSLFKSQGYKNFLLAVIDGNKIAMKFYNKFGFRAYAHSLFKPL